MQQLAEETESAREHPTTIPQETFIKSRSLEGPMEKLLQRGEIQALRGLSVLEGHSFDGFIVHMIREYIQTHYLDDNGTEQALRWRLSSGE